MAKIIAVADVFDALTAKRHYRDALSSEAAFEILEQGIGTQFDENVVEALKKYWEKQRSQQIEPTEWVFGKKGLFSPVYQLE